MNKLLKPMALVLLIGVCFTAGYWFRQVVEARNPHHRQIRLDGYRFISPLVECETIHPISSAHPDLGSVRNAVQRVIDTHLKQGSARNISFYFRDLENGVSIGIRENAKFTPASLMKVALMISVLKRAEHDAALLNKKLLYQGDDSTQVQDIRPGSTLRPGSRYAVDELIDRMIVRSDNNAALLLADYFGIQSLANMMEELGIPVEPGPTGDLITLRDYSAFFRILYNASYLDDHLSERALAYLARSAFDEGIRAGLPRDMLVASKFGEYSAGVYQLQEFGIVYYPEHPYLLGIVAKGGTRTSHTQVMREISKTIYQELNRQHGAHTEKREG